MGGGREKQKPHLLVESSCGIRQEPTLSDVPGAWMKILNGSVFREQILCTIFLRNHSLQHKRLLRKQSSPGTREEVHYYTEHFDQESLGKSSCSRSSELLKQTVRA